LRQHCAGVLTQLKRLVSIRLQSGFAGETTASLFEREITMVVDSRNDLHPALSRLDAALFQLVQSVDILEAISPQNYKQERQRFFDSNYSENPEFVYLKKPVDAFLLKRALFALPVDSLEDDDLCLLYQDIIESYVDKFDQFKSVGTQDFLYDSLRYYGEPNEKDLRNAGFILHLPTDTENGAGEKCDAEAIQRYLESFAQREGYEYKLEINDSMIANALVSGTTIKINRSASISKTEMQALAHHELGVHLVTTLNARRQPLRVLTMGCPFNTMTQEGLAILCEYLAGCLTLSRLKVLALRVLAVDSMIKEKDFKKTFLFLFEEHGVGAEMAFTITARVYRGGGFTKDYLYLQGFHQMLNAYESESDFNALLSGKVSIAYLPIVSRLIAKGLLEAPVFVSPAITAPQQNNTIQQFIAHAIK